MIRPLIEQTLLFFIPFALFLFWLMIRRRNPFAREAWEGTFGWLFMAGIVLGIAALLYTGISAPREQGSYVPPHLENGQLVPGQFR